jgi:hypothetical protein
MIARWAAFLNLSGWVKWRDVEAIPLAYTHTFWAAPFFSPATPGAPGRDLFFV